MSRPAAPAAACVTQIVRYPIKGFNGQQLLSATLRPNVGLPFDRVLAVSNGSTELGASAAWTPAKAFYQLRQHAGLARFQLVAVNSDGQADGALVELIGPDDHRLRIDLRCPAGDHATATLARWLPSGPYGPPRLVAARRRFWDWPDAAVSIINLETLAELDTASGCRLDARRFRANLYVSGMPAWSELSLLGHRIRVGDCELEVLRPIDRCRATAVDPDDASTSINVPALLASRFGHLFCGLYARVVVPGRITLDDRLEDLGPAQSSISEGASVHDAPPIANWPRRATVAHRHRESHDVTSFWMRDPLSQWVGHARPGQHVRVHGADSIGPLWRSYTVSGVDADLIRITVRDVAADGAMSRLLHRDALAGSALTITGPFGDAGPELAGVAQARPLLLASAGIGITPTVSFLRAVKERIETRPIIVVHIARSAADLALWTEVESIAAQTPQIDTHLFLTRQTQPKPSSLRAALRRPKLPELVALLASHAPTSVTAHLCGPTAFMRDLHTALVEFGVQPQHIHTDVFASPAGSAGEATPPPREGPFRVRFADSDTTAEWTSASGTLLELAETEGLQLPAACRAGACGTCAQTITAGHTAYTTQPVLPPSGATVLLCSAVPTSDLTIDA